MRPYDSPSRTDHLRSRCASSCRNVSATSVMPASTPSSCANEPGDRGLVLADARDRRDVAEDTEVLGECVLDDRRTIGRGGSKVVMCGISL